MGFSEINMVNTIENIKKPHKYNVGDEITVKIATVREGGTEYSFVGAENTFFSEKAIEEMEVKMIKPGDIVYTVFKPDWDDVICFDAAVVEDIGTKEVKICGDWVGIDDEIFFDKNEAEEKALELSKKYNLPISKQGLFELEDKNGRE